MEKPMPGGQVGPYELLAPLGAGGMGEVWKARDTRLDRTVAIKFARAAFSDRAQGEARAIAALNHPNIATLYDVGPDYLVMEYVDGAPPRPTDDVRKLLDLAAQIADGLAAAHAAGIVHRDLKPDNILVTKIGRVKILDFGLAKQSAAEAAATQAMTITQPGTVVGTVAYMSPEQARGQELDARSDQFSFGLILYELAAGRPAFARGSAPELMTAIIREDAPPLPSSVPAPVQWTIERCLAKSPAERYASTADLALEVRRLSTRVTAFAAAAAPAMAAPRRRIPAAAMMAGIAAAIAAYLAYALASMPADVDPSQYHFTPFAATRANETDPVWSPDGRSIAYLSRVGTDVQLMVKRVDGSAEPVELARGRSFLRLSWSADGERIYYHDRSIPPGHIAWVSRAGGEPVRLGPDFEGNAVGAPAMSPDGKTLAFLKMEQVQGRARRRLALSSPPGSAPKVVGAGLPCCVTPTGLEWSPDSRHLIGEIAAGGDEPYFWMLDVDGTARPIARVPSGMHPEAGWLPGGRYAVVSAMAARGPDAGLRLLDLRSGALRPLLPSAVPLSEVAISRDGSRIAYITQSHGFGLREIRLDGGRVRELAPSNIDQWGAAWSPVGNQLVFVRFGELVVRDGAEGHERVLLTTKDFPRADPLLSLSWPVFSPDGRRIIFTCNGCEPGLSLWTVPANGGTPARVTGGRDGGYAATWSPDGQWIAYNNTATGETTTLHKLRVGSGEASVQVVPHGCYQPDWSPTGEWIACGAGQSRAVELISPDGARHRTLGASSGSVAWSHDGRLLYNIRRDRPDGTRILLEEIDIASGRTKPLGGLPEELVPSSTVAGARFSPAPDGKSLAVSVLEQDADIWILDGVKPPRSSWERLWPWKR